MMQDLTYNEFIKLREDYPAVAVFKTFQVPFENVAKIHHYLQKTYKIEGVIFESHGVNENTPSVFMSFEPRKTHVIPYGTHEDPLPTLRNFLKDSSLGVRQDIAKFLTKAMGFITYDAVHTFEKISNHHLLDNVLPLARITLYTINLALNLKTRTLFISVTSDNNKASDLSAEYDAAQKKLDAFMIKLWEAHQSHFASHPTKITSLTPVTINPSCERFMANVMKAKTFIRKGDAFQIVLSRTFQRPYSILPIQLYACLHEIGKAPFMFYFPTENGVILGASPERFVAIEGRQMTVNPIAGTRIRPDHTFNKKNQQSLLKDEKELAEHRMLVDLARNDIGRIAKPGSIAIREFMQVKHYSHVSHITSSISGELSDDYDAFDAVKAAFPAGTLSGAPKIRAMQIIAEIEKTPRGIYGGTIFRLDEKGNFESAIAIRTALLHQGIATIRTGAGIVFDSNPKHEAFETQNKARALLEALAKAHGEMACFY